MLAYTAHALSTHAMFYLRASSRGEAAAATQPLGLRSPPTSDLARVLSSLPLPVHVRALAPACRLSDIVSAVVIIALHAMVQL